MAVVIYPGPHKAVVLPDGTVLKKDNPTKVDDVFVEGLINQGCVEPKGEGK